MPNAIQTTSDFKGDNLCVNMFGAIPDLLFATDGNCAASTAFTTSVTVFTATDVGKLIWIENLSGSADFLTTIAAYVGAHAITLAAAPTFTVTATNFRYGTDNTVSIQGAFDWGASRGIRVMFGRGAYGITASLSPSNCLFIHGHGYTENNNPATAATQIVCCADVPIINFTGSPFPSDFLESFQCEKITFVGTSRDGSKGIYLNATYGTIIRDTSFNYFGNQAIQMDSGESGRLEHIQAQYCWMVRTGQTDYVGVVQCGASDMIIDHVVATSNESYIPTVPQSGKYGTGFIAAISVMGGNSFIHDCQGHGTEIGYFVGGPFSNRAQSSASTFVNCRADQNQGQGFVVAGFNNHFIGCRGYTNSLDADGAHNFCDVLIAGGNVFSSCQIIGPANTLTNRYNNIFKTTTPNTNEANYFRLNYIAAGCFTGADYLFSGTQTNQPIIDDIASETSIGNAAAVRVRSELIMKSHNLWVQNANLFIQDTAAGTDAKLWSERVNDPANRNQLLRSVFSDSGVTETVYERITRSSTVVSLIELIATAVSIIGNLQINSGNLIEFLSTGTTITTGSGSPNGAVTAPAGSLYTDTNGNTWVKNSGSGSTGWLQLASGLSIPVSVSSGGTGDNSLTLNGLLYGNGTSPVAAVPVGGNGQVLIGNTSAPPSWQTGLGSSGTPLVINTAKLTLGGSFGAQTFINGMLVAQTQAT